ncbi:hypothetical protein RUM43_006581 [Polyplax serrata]|uniref:Uncharacterized protein n=1 Tax=Polyplax serrata TaxID=468196 RepID=A0AAN8S933_POLSC
MTMTANGEEKEIRKFVDEADELETNLEEGGCGDIDRTGRRPGTSPPHHKPVSNRPTEKKTKLNKKPNSSLTTLTGTEEASVIKKPQKKVQLTIYNQDSKRPLGTSASTDFYKSGGKQEKVH